MRMLVHYFRQCFCKHNFEIQDITVKYHTGNGWGDYKKEEKIKRYMYCNKCGYHTTHIIVE